MNNKSYLTILLITLVSLLLVTTKTSGATWKTKVVDSSGDVGSYTSIALDKSGKTHISYYDNTNQDLKYTTNASGSWTTETVDSREGVGTHTSIALDSSGKVHISYSDDTNYDLKYATNATGSWVTETVDSDGGTATSIALDTSDKVHISYHANGDLKYATNASGSWVKDTVDSFVSGITSVNILGDTSIALDISVNVHISINNDYTDLVTGGITSYLSTLYYTNVSGSWVTERLDMGNHIKGVPYTPIASDTSGNIHIIYIHADHGLLFDTPPFENHLTHATNASGTWVTETVDSSNQNLVLNGLLYENVGMVGEYASVAVDTSDNVHISYYDSNDNDLKYATNTSGSWITETVDSDELVGQFTSIAVDTSENVHISYYDATNGQVKYATTRTNPLPDIKANGSDGPVTPPDNLSVTVALDPVGHSGDNADWWVAADVSGTSTIDGWYYFDVGTMNWTYAGVSYTDLFPTYQWPLFDLSPPFEVLNMSGLPGGTYTFYFAVDTNRNGVLDLDQLYYDIVVVNITP